MINNFKIVNNKQMRASKHKTIRMKQGIYQDCLRNKKCKIGYAEGISRIENILGF